MTACMPIHARNECLLFSSNRVQFPPRFLSPLHVTLCISIVRGAGLHNNNDGSERVYDDLMELQHLPSIPRSAGQVRSDEACLSAFQEWTHGVKDSAGDWRRIMHLMAINGFGVRLVQQNPDHKTFRIRTGTFVYRKVSRMNHSCTPNCTWNVGPLPDFKMRIRNSIPILQGQPLTISYYQSVESFGTMERQKFCRNFGGFICTCPRCLDPTEMATFTSGVTCTFCRDECTKLGIHDDTQYGYFLPIDPLNISAGAEWACTKCGLTKIAATTFLPVIEELKILIEKKEQLYAGKSFDKLEQFCDKISEKYSKMILHKNHWILQEAARTIVNFKFPLIGSLDAKNLVKFIDLNLYLLAISDKIFPGLSFDRSQIQLRASRGLVLLLKRFGGDMSTTQIINYLNLCTKMQEEAILYYDGDHPPRGETRHHNAILLEKDINWIKQRRAAVTII